MLISTLFTGAGQSQVHILIVLVTKMLFNKECFETFLKNSDRRTLSDVYRGGIPVLGLLYRKPNHHVFGKQTTLL